MFKYFLSIIITLKFKDILTREKLLFFLPNENDKKNKRKNWKSSCLLLNRNCSCVFWLIISLGMYFFVQSNEAILLFDNIQLKSQFFFLWQIWLSNSVLYFMVVLLWLNVDLTNLSRVTTITKPKTNNYGKSVKSNDTFYTKILWSNIFLTFQCSQFINTIKYGKNLHQFNCNFIFNCYHFPCMQSTCYRHLISKFVVFSLDFIDNHTCLTTTWKVRR